MKIYDSNPGGAAASGTQRSQETHQVDRSGGSHKASSSGDGRDSVEFTGALGRLSKVLSGFQGDRTERVQALAAQYRSGGYRVDSKAVSSAMVSEAMS